MQSRISDTLHQGQKNGDLIDRQIKLQPRQLGQTNVE
jgi:hypothetical protein